MFINDVKRDGYTCFNSIADKRERNKQVNAVKYIDDFASQSHTDIREWNLVTVFATDGMFPVNRNTINKIFWAYRSNHQARDYDIGGAMLAKLKELETRIPSRDLSNLDREIANIKHELGRQESTMKTAMRNLRRKIDFKDNLEGTVANFPEMVEKVVKEGFWELLEINDMTLRFKTKNDCYLKYKNDAQKVNINLNTGSWIVEYNISRGVIKVLKGGNNIVTNITWTSHPHVSGENICTGDMSAEYRDGKAYKLIDKVMEIVQCSLTIYNHGSPYVRIDQLAQDRETMELNQEKERERVNNETLNNVIKETQGAEDNGKEEDRVEESPSDQVTHSIGFRAVRVEDIVNESIDAESLANDSQGTESN